MITRHLGYLIVSAGILITVLFVLKYKVYDLENELRVVNRKIKITTDSLRVLRAEFHYLNRPDRIRVLVNKLTTLKPLSEKHVFTESELSFGQSSSTQEVV